MPFLDPTSGIIVSAQENLFLDPLFQGAPPSLNPKIAFDNIGIGTFAMNGLTTGTHNIAIGDSAMLSGPGAGFNNIGIGNGVMNGFPFTGNNNVGIGVASCGAVTSGTNNIGIGFGGAPSVGTGSHNIGIGNNTISGVLTGLYNIGIGFLSGATLDLVNSVGVGSNVVPGASNVCAIGQIAGGVYPLHVGIGTLLPASTLDVHDTTNLLIAGANVGLQGATAGGFIAAYSDPGATIAVGSRLGGHLIGANNDLLHNLIQTAGITSFALENWTGVGRGSNLVFESTLTGAAARSTRGTFDGIGNFILTGPVKTAIYTVATLPAVATVGAGTRAFVSDATATAFASIVAGGGANQVPVYCNGVNWLIG